MIRGNKNKGFTLIEMMVVLAIVVIVITLSTPVSNLYRKNRITTQVQDFIGALNIARSEAISRATTMSICIPEYMPKEPDGTPVLDPSTGEPIELRCMPNTGGTTSWAGGWMVFQDANENCNIDANLGEEIISEHSPISQGYSLNVPAINCIKYTSAGIAPGTNAVWTMCDPTKSTRLKRGIRIRVSGRANIFDIDGQASEDIAMKACP